jgi:membrane associated rhomboid family serine protease
MIPIKDDAPAHRTPYVGYAVIAACVLVFLWQLSLPPLQQQVAAVRYGLVPALLTGAAELDPRLSPLPPALTIVTSMFLHGGWAHLLGNMLYLWIFGNNVEDRLGHVGFALFYLGTGFAAAAAQVLPAPASTIPMIGASGAISGVLGAYLVLYPHARVLVFIPISFMFLYRIPAKWLLGFWFGFQLLSALATPADVAGVAWWAHIGGFVAGALVALPLRRGIRARRRGPWG